MDQLSIVAVLQISYLVQRKWFFRPEGNGSIQLAFNNFLITNFFSVVLLLIAQEHDFIKLSPKSPPKSPKIGSIVKSEFFLTGSRSKLDGKPPKTHRKLD